ncbi:hypothetical protein F5Y15DRAFT_384746 [Xylariaceae sp. FL0016]|nr:hypothetical protein F5Y15DRAFT_384746 [Xylariaceae sp. FL0016]
MSAKAPSEGTKVTLGQNAPVTQEGPGAIASDSLAAESQTFREANHAEPGQAPKPQQGAHAAQPSGSTGSTGGAQHVGTAPTYVENMNQTYAGGPHGKNIKEDDSIGTEDKAKNASFTEFGTENDPGMAAEQKFTRAAVASAGTSAGREKELDGKTPYDALGAEKEA